MCKHTCQNCGAAFEAKIATASFCPKDAATGRDCKTAFHNRMTVEGKPIMPLLKVWRATRGRGGDKALNRAALNEACRLIDASNAADRVAGRPSPQALVRRKMAYGLGHSG